MVEPMLSGPSYPTRLVEIIFDLTEVEISIQMVASKPEQKLTHACKSACGLDKNEFSAATVTFLEPNYLLRHVERISNQTSQKWEIQVSDF